MRRSSSVKATHEGVIRLPWSLAIISTLPPRWTLSRQLVLGLCLGKLHSRNTRVRRSQVDTNNSAIVVLLGVLRLDLVADG